MIESGRIEIVSPASRDDPEAVVAVYEGGGFLGELNFLTGQTAYLIGRVADAGRIHRISREQFRRVLAEDPEVSDILVRTFLARRDLLRGGPAARGIAILGSASSSESLALRTFAARQRLPHLWLDADSAAGRALIDSAHLLTSDLPAVFTPHDVLRGATPGEMAQLLGLAYRRDTTDLVDLTVIGSGPAGLGAAVYGASEGLDTVVLDAVAIGGQAAASSRIENYLGFPSGLSGQDLTQRAALQAMKFGAQLSSPCRVVDLDTSGAHLSVTLSDGTTIDTRAVLIASGVRYKSLPLPRWNHFEGAGIYYAATELEARACCSQPVTVIGGANSAGQAALYLASRGSLVTLAVRGPDAGATMSSYLLGRIVADPRITMRTLSEVTALHGNTALDSITLTDATCGTSAGQCVSACSASSAPNRQRTGSAMSNWTPTASSAPTPNSTPTHSALPGPHSDGHRFPLKPACPESLPLEMSDWDRSNASRPPSERAPAPCARSTPRSEFAPDPVISRTHASSTTHQLRKPLPDPAVPQRNTRTQIGTDNDRLTHSGLRRHWSDWPRCRRSPARHRQPGASTRPSRRRARRHTA